MPTPLELHGTLLREIEDPVAGRGSASVVDLADRSTIFRYDSDRPRIMASTTKIFTAGAALAALGPNATATTHLVADNPPDDTGVLHGNLYVIGGGDLTLGDTHHVESKHAGIGTSVDRIVEQVRTSGIRKIRGSVVGDGSFYRSEPGVKVVTAALTFNRSNDDDPVTFAAERITGALREGGVSISHQPMEGAAQTTGHFPLGTVYSPPLVNLLITMGHDSDNFIAESITKLIVAGEQDSASVRDGAAHIQEYAKTHGTRIEIVNGSGLGSENLASTATITDYLSSVAKAEYASELIRTLPRAGADGTLRLRMRNTLASDCVRAKTGTLTRSKRPLQDSLAGYVFGRNRTAAFSIVREKAETRFAGRVSIDRMVNAIANYCN